MTKKDPQTGASHYSDQQWADFVRGTAGEANREEMQTHLQTGCPSCLASVSWMKDVAAMAATDRVLEVPEDLVRKAREIFEVPRAHPGWMDTLEAIAARLIAENRLDWHAAGVRSAASAGETGLRLLYRAGDYSVDVKVVPPSASDAGEVIGQIANESDQRENLDGVVVQMVVLGQALSETATNRFGEFLIEYPTGKKATLRLALKHRGQRIDLPLKPI